MNGVLLAVFLFVSLQIERLKSLDVFHQHVIQELLLFVFQVDLVAGCVLVDYLLVSTQSIRETLRRDVQKILGNFFDEDVDVL